MLVFVDESGDTGFKFNQGSSKHFLVSMVFFKENELAAETAQKIQDLRNQIDWNKEFHFKELPNKVRNHFYQYVNSDFYYRSIVIDKRDIYSSYLKQNKKQFYNFVVGQMVRYDGNHLNDAKIIVDKSCDKIFQTELKVYLRRQARENGYFIKDIKFKDWKENSLVQVADMVCGAIYRKFERQEDTFYNQILRKENNLWRFR